MARKKKTEKGVREEMNEEGQISVSFGLASDTKRSIAAIACFAFALVFVLAFFSQAGVVGEFLDKRVSGAVFGWGKWIFPLFLLFSGYLFLRKSVKFHVTSFFGLVVAFFGILGMLHLLFFQSKEFYEAASHASGGGFVGYALAFLLDKYTGGVAGFIILLSMFGIGTLVAFDVSLFPFILLARKIKNALHRRKNQESDTEESVEVKENYDSAEISDQMKEEELFEESGSNEKINAYDDVPENIKNIRFDDDKNTHVNGANVLHDQDTPFTQDILHSHEEQSSSTTSVERESFFSRLQNGFQFEDVPREPWELPTMDMLEKGKSKANPGNVQERKRIIQETLAEFGIVVEPAEERIGPTVTQYTFRPSPGVRLEKILSLHNNLAMALSAHPIRIEAPIPGTPFVGIEVPNQSHEHVNMRDALNDLFSKHKESKLFMTIGKKMSGEFEHRDIASMPHLLVAGSTGTGKSVCVNSLLMALLFSNTPDELQLILVDPKKVELSFYEDIPHLAASVVTENKKVVGVLRWAVRKMEERYEIMKEENVRSIKDYNKKIRKRKQNDPSAIMPSIVIVIDELADLMSSHGKEVEGAIVRLAQMARAVGIHLIVSTQRPDVKVLTGLIKTNITNRIALKVATQIDSRTILDKGGAEKLLGRGDMLFMDASSSSLTRLQGVFVSDREIRSLVKFWKDQADRRGNIPNEVDIPSDQPNGVALDESSVFPNTETSPAQISSEVDFEQFILEESDEREQQLYNSAKEYVIQKGQASTSAIQRSLRIGYNHAARIMDDLEKNGVVSSQNASKPREILPPYARSMSLDVRPENDGEGERG